ncbi:hypothetical protein [Nitrosospira multiformis]|uniref:hypothetical protein n=1 Tax=Nitrosospira multiformis TaxID=1231 RepID=UPI0011146BF6|nr:hypothetical protein [Nitrosospira multiformis]
MGPRSQYYFWRARKAKAAKSLAAGRPMLLGDGTLLWAITSWNTGARCKQSSFKQSPIPG